MILAKQRLRQRRQPQWYRTTKDEIAVVEQYDIVADREKMNSELVNSDEVDRIVSTIEVNNLETIVIIWSGGCRRNFESIGCRVKQHEYVTA